jgi:hypothetical protein
MRTGAELAPTCPCAKPSDANVLKQVTNVQAVIVRMGAMTLRRKKTQCVRITLASKTVESPTLAKVVNFDSLRSSRSPGVTPTKDNADNDEELSPQNQERVEEMMGRIRRGWRK